MGFSPEWLPLISTRLLEQPSQQLKLWQCCSWKHFDFTVLNERPANDVRRRTSIIAPNRPVSPSQEHINVSYPKDITNALHRRQRYHAWRLTIGQGANTLKLLTRTIQKNDEADLNTELDEKRQRQEAEIGDRKSVV